jgi:hypothetical protein
LFSTESAFFIFLFLIPKKAVHSKFVMDDMNFEANPEYLEISANIDKSGEDPVVNAKIDIKQDVADLKVKVSLSAKIGGEFKEIYPVATFNPCKDEVEDEFVKYALDQIEKFGNLKIACPLKKVITVKQKRSNF